MTTAVAAPPQTPSPKATIPSASGIYRLSVKQYQQMITERILTDEDRTELLEGILVPKMPRNPQHDGTLDLITQLLKPIPMIGWIVREQRAIELTDSQPEPDLAFARGNGRSFLTRHPTAAELGLVIEVADSTLARDRGDKLRIYAAAGIVEYWIVNLVDLQVEVHTQPSGSTYTAVQTYLPGQSIPLVLDGVAIANIPVAELLP